jgi:acyl-[acyl-carrier-protein]-phospholipid O-acyltransferase/long-chain-fatty-acid--[acyl-carrier-protein] ligase
MSNNDNYLFKSKRFLPIFITQFFSCFNDNLLKNSLIILVTYKLSEQLILPAIFIVLLANALFIIPYILFAGIAGQIADKYENTIIIKIVKFIEIIISIAAVYGFYTENVLLLLILIFFMGVHSAFFGPIKYSILPNHLKRDELIPANGYIEGSTFFSILVGTLIGGLYVGASNIVISILVFSSIIGFISSFYIPKTTNFNSNLVINKNIVKEIFVIMKYANSRRNLLLCILGISWFWFLGSALLSQVPLLAKEVLYADYGVSNLFLAVFSIGVAVGSFLCKKIVSNEVTVKYLFISSIGVSFFGIDLYFACKTCYNVCDINSLQNIFTFLSDIKSWRILLDLFCMSSITGVYVVPLYAVMQYYSPATHRSRIIATNNLYNSIFMIGSFILISTMFKLGFTVHTVILMLSIANIGVSIFILSFSPEIRLIPDPVMKWAATSLFNWLYKVEVKGIENYKKAGDKVVIIANHTSYLDSALLSLYLPEKPIFAIDRHVASKWWVKIFLNYNKTHKVDNINAMGIKSLINMVKRGKKVAIFPEGRISSTGSLMKVYDGPGMIADKADAMILPIMINGVQYTHFSKLNTLSKRKIFTKIVINILPAIKLEAPDSLDIRSRRKYMSESLYQIMSDMFFKSTNYDQTIYQSLIDIAKIVGFNKVLFKDIDNTQLTFRKLFKENFLLSSYILKFSNKNLVGLLLPNYNIYPSMFFALQAIGKVPLLINSELDSKEIINECKTASLDIIFSSKRYIESMKKEGFIKDLENNFSIIYLEDIANEINLGMRIKALILSYFPQTTYNKLCVNQESNNIGIVMFNSENYDNPKLVEFTHKNILSNIAQVKARIDFKIHDVSFNTIPLYNISSLSSTLMMTLSGIQTFLYHTATHYRIVPEMIYMYDATILFSTNSLLVNYAKSAHPYDFSSVRYVFSSGEKLSTYTKKLWMEIYGIKIYENCALTEASSFIAFNTPMYNKKSTQGRLLPKINFKIQKISDIQSGGKLSLNGPNIVLGYSSENSNVNLEDMWFDTNYIANVDSEHYLTILGNLNRYKLINKEYINLDLIEDIAKEIDELSESVALFIDKTESIILFTTSNIIDVNSYKEFLKRNNYSTNYLPESFKTLTNIPITDSGNYNRKKLLSIIINNN